jgi:glucose/arabinose dehydrogenase
LLGLDLDPDFVTNGFMYVYYTYGNPIRNKIVRLIERGGFAVIDQTLLENIPGGTQHDGGRLKFGPDLKLYATVGDSTCIQAQDDNSLGGKILRMNSDGSVPDDNPFPERPYPASLVLSKGNRNPEGIAWDSSGQLYETEHGPTGDCGYPGSSYDEVNIIYPGGNYGWPCCRGVVCRPECGTPPFIDPIRYWQPASEGGEGTAAPAGAGFLNDWFYFGTLGANFTPPPLYARHVHGLYFDMPGGTEILYEVILFFAQYGRIRDVVADPVGQHIYFTTSNRDGRIEMELIDPDDDRVFRVTF